MSMSTITMSTGTLTTAYGIYNFVNAKGSKERRNAMFTTAAGIVIVAMGYFSEGGYLSHVFGEGTENIDCTDLSETFSSPEENCEAALKKLDQIFRHKEPFIEKMFKEGDLYKLKSIVDKHVGFSCENYLPSLNISKNKDLFAERVLQPNHLEKSVMWGFNENRFFVAFKDFCGFDNTTTVDTIYQEGRSLYDIKYGSIFGECNLDSGHGKIEVILNRFTTLLEKGFLEMYPFFNEVWGKQHGGIINRTLPI
ncbi:MAG: hypothetical protein K1000chlam3_00216 [Chlamydiae bacterium]|nr:hypothetical protein [Chlamydiota bacterium]